MAPKYTEHIVVKLTLEQLASLTRLIHKDSKKTGYEISLSNYVRKLIEDKAKEEK